MATEVVVAKTGELKDGQMKQVEVGRRSILLVRVDGKFYALGARCTHRGAPLAEGVMHKCQVRCPWHQACFDVATGDLTEPPALDELPRFDVRVEGEDVIVRVPDKPEIRRIPSMAKYNPDRDDRTFLIIGAGAAGDAAAEKLRQDGFQGRILMITHEKYLPYDRTVLTKGYLRRQTSRYPALRSRKFYTDYGIELLTGKEVVSVSPSRKKITLGDGSSFSYDKLLIATGAQPRGLPVPGAELPGIFTLRSLDDAHAIRSELEGISRVVVIGASFIGMEASSTLAREGVTITVVALESFPFELILGEEVGKMFKEMHEENGVSFRMNVKVTRFEGNGRVKKVILDNGEELEAELVLLGVGVKPIAPSIEGVTPNPDGSLPANEFLQVADDVYAAGDVASFINWQTKKRLKVEHWRLAQQHGRIAARNMMGDQIEFRAVPFFWTGQFGVNLCCVGNTRGWDGLIIHGEIFRKDFIAFYVKKGKIIAAAGCGNDRELAMVAELMEEGKMPEADKLRQSSFNLTYFLNEE